MTTPTTPTVYHSRARTTRKRLIIVGSVLALVLVGFLIGRLANGKPASGSAAAASAPASAPVVVSSAPEPPSTAPTTPAGPSGIDAYAPIQAESATLTGVDKENTQDTGGGQDVGWITKGDSMRFDGIDFGATPATSFVARLASAAGDNVHGRVLIRIDSPDSAPVGTLPISNTGGWQNWINQATDVTAVTGVHTVFLTFDADTGDDFLNLNYVKFDRASS